MRKAIVAICLSAAACAAGSCGAERPSRPDGSNTLDIVALDTSGLNSSEWLGVPGASVEVGGLTADYKRVFETDGEGRLVVENLPAGVYTVQATKRDEVNKILFIGQATEKLTDAIPVSDTIFMSFMPTSPIVINELYYTGCNAASSYFYDQFVELYNTTDETFYLDGYSIVRSSQVTTYIDYDPEESDVALGYYVYAFPGVRGVTQNCPIGPKEFLVIAGDATDHSLYGALCVDMSHPDWEFFNALANDFDNPAVPNLNPISTEGRDFVLSLGHTGVWLATTEEYRFQEHSYVNSSGGITRTMYVEMPLYTILDAVEYATNLSSERYMTVRLDAGYGGIGMVRYGGQSIERKVPGLDSNNSTFDFEIVAPTPGYSHSRL